MHPFWYAVFGNPNPVEVEIGPGTGTFLLRAAADHPQTNFLGLEHSHSRAARLEAAISWRDLRNARVIASDAACVVSRLIPTASVSAYHVYFPDPWWKRRHHRRRLFTPEFAAALASTLAPSGCLYVATDVDDLFASIRTTLHNCGAFAESEGHSSRIGPTAFERKGLARGAFIRDATFIKRVAQTGPAALTPAAPRQ